MRLLNVDKIAGRLAQTGVRLRADVLPLVKLLAVAPPGEVGEEGAARPVGPVVRASVPCMTVEDQDRAGGGDRDHLIRMRRTRVGDLLLRQTPAPMGAGYEPCRAVVSREVVEEP